LLNLPQQLEHQERQNRERKSAGAAWKDTGYVFTTEIGTPIEPDNLRRSWYPLRAAAGLDGVRLHDLRHSCVTLLLELKVPPHIVQAIVGRQPGRDDDDLRAHVAGRQTRGVTPARRASGVVPTDRRRGALR
jgi:integrase